MRYRYYVRLSDTGWKDMWLSDKAGDSVRFTTLREATLAAVKHRLLGKNPLVFRAGMRMSNTASVVWPMRVDNVGWGTSNDEILARSKT